MTTSTSNGMTMTVNPMSEEELYDTSDLTRNADRIPLDIPTNENYRKRREFQPKSINSYELIFLAGEFFMYLIKFLVVYKLLQGYYNETEWMFFVLTLSLFALPLACTQLLSCKWYFNDGIKNCCAKLFIVIAHMLMLGPALRSCYVIWYGVKYSRNKDNRNKIYYTKYTAQRRDQSLLRCIRIFWTEGGQAILQLYVLLKTNNFQEGKINGNDLVRSVEVVWAVFSMAYGVVVFQNDLRKHKGLKGYSICAYLSQMSYRILFIVSRILAIALFVRVCHPIIVFILFIHVVMVMICMIRYDRKGRPFFLNKDGNSNRAFENLFYITLGIIHVFCYLKVTKCASNKRLVPYCVLYLLQNALMFTTWLLLSKRHYGILETVTVTCLLGFPLLGIIFHQLYYVACHPKSHSYKGQVSSDQWSLR